MQFPKALLLSCTLVLFVSAAVNAQQTSTSSPTAVVPQLVNFSGGRLMLNECWATHAAGVRSGRRWIGRSAKPWGNLSQIVPHREFQPAAAFHDRENRRDFGIRQWAADVYPSSSDYVHVCIIDLHLIWKPVEMRGGPAAIDT